MKSTCKYLLPAEDYPEITMPLAAELLHVGEQHGDLFVWARVRSDLPTITRRFRVAETGCPEVDCGTHVGTIQTASDTLRNGPVFHVFDLGEIGYPHARTP